MKTEKTYNCENLKTTIKKLRILQEKSQKYIQKQYYML